MSEDLKDYVAFSIVGLAVVGLLGGLTYFLFLEIGWWALFAMASVCALAWALSRLHPVPMPFRKEPETEKRNDT